MKRFLLLFCVTALLAPCSLRADEAVASVQRTLKAQGFYYGEVTCKRDADTTAALRRYQIRNGLRITGELDTETRKSLGVKDGGAPAPRTTPIPARPSNPPMPARLPNDTSDLRGGGTPGREVPLEYPPTERGALLETSGLFAGTPYEAAPFDLQRRVIVGAQSMLARRGYYRSEIDGVYGPGMAFALRAYQSRFGMDVNGRLGMETLGALGLLPGQQAPGLTAPRQQTIQRRTILPNGEPIYQGR